MLVSPEEAEELIPLCQGAPKHLVHLLAYATPLTQKMLQFNDLNYYAVPPLPTDWSAPIWLKIHIGLYAGRLYFPFEEHGQLRELLGLQDDVVMSAQDDWAEEMVDLQIESLDPSDDNQSSTEDEDVPSVYKEDAVTKEERASKFKATRMLTFLHAWLGTRSRGQDFTHTPMGYLCARKPLKEDHPFFRTPDDETSRSRMEFAMAEDTSAFPDLDIAKDDDDQSDIGDEELDAHHKLTEEQLKTAELAAKEADGEVEDKAEDEEGSESESC